MAMRICLLTDTFYPMQGGGENHARLLSRELIRMGHSVRVLTRRLESNWAARETIDEGLEIVRLPPSRGGRFGKYLLTVPAWRYLTRNANDYDVVLVCCFRVAGVPAVLASRRTHKPCVFRAESRGELSGGFIWDSPDASIRATPARACVRAYLAWRNRILLRAPAFAAISREIEQEFKECGVPPARVHYIPNGIDTELFRPLPDDQKQRRRRELGLPDGSLWMYAGKLNKGKGLERLLRVWARIAAERTGEHLVLVGGGGGQYLSCETELRDFVRARGLEKRVTFTGYQERVYDWLPCADGFVFPSENEAFGLAIVEAMACGVPVIASRTGGIPDIVQHGENGWLVDDCKNDEAWHKELCGLMANPARTRAWAEAGRKTAEQRFSIKEVARTYVALLESVIAEGRDLS